MPPLEEMLGKKQVGIAFDNMIVKPHQLDTIPGIYPAISRYCTFNMYCTKLTRIYKFLQLRWMWDHLEDMQTKAEHYKRKFVVGHQVIEIELMIQESFS